MATSLHPQLSKDEADYIIPHVFLPPKLPQAGPDPHNSSVVAHEKKLFTIVSGALKNFRFYVGHTMKNAIDAADKAICRLRDSSYGAINEGSLFDAFCDLKGNGGFLPIYVQAQNAAIITSCERDSIQFEVFEISPTNEAAMKTEGRLRRCFPASCVSVPMKTFDDDEFKSALANTVAKMSHQEVTETKARVKKAGDSHIEDRDTTDPLIVTDFLVTVLCAPGEIVPVSQLRKNTREEVVWRDAKSPWRRSPSWLLTRVTLQMILSRLASSETLYKEFMAFFLAYILRTTPCSLLVSDTLYCMSAKITRRLLKLGQERHYPWLPEVEKVISSTRDLIQERWTAIQTSPNYRVDLKSLTTLNVEQDTHASFPKLDEFIRQIDSRRNVENIKSFKPSPLAVKPESSNLPSIQSNMTGEEMLFSLISFEDWVRVSLDNWLHSHIGDHETCAALNVAISSYHRNASSCYNFNPESLSVMLLTIMELWVACDKSACKELDLLSQYDPDVPYKLLQNLVLPFKEQMERLNRIEVYIQARQKAAKAENPSIFSSFGHPRSFPVLYFARCKTLQNLYQRIIDQAKDERENKKIEFQRLKTEYNRLIHLSDQRQDCDFIQVVDSWGDSSPVHSYTCLKCHYQDQAEALTIEVHEWPLPTNTLKAQSTVFEMKVPHLLNNWRDATTYVRLDVLEETYVGPEKFDIARTLGDYMGWPLYDFIYRRITLVSHTKPNRGTHRRGKLIGTATENDVLVQNGMSYAYYDDAHRCLVSNTENTTAVLKMCTYQLSEKCVSLQKFMFRPPDAPNGLTPNHVISGQAACPDHLTLEEYKAMASLPVGYRIQWSNILTQLHLPAVDFKNVDLVLMLLQISRQAGPPLDQSPYRASHQPLGDHAFTANALKGLTLALERIRRNWESRHALGGFVALTTRLLTLAPSFAAATECFLFLESCRSVASDWLHRLQDNINQSENDTQRMEFLARAFEIAHILVSSFDVEESDLKALLSDSTHASTLIDASIAIQTTMHSALRPHDVHHRHLTHRWKRLLYKSWPILIDKIVGKQSPCLDLAIRMSWPAYSRGDGWRPVSANAEFCLTTRARSTTGIDTSIIHFNILTAELLVNGFPLCRLPACYLEHPIYGTLFGKASLEVLPTSVPGMQFTSKKLHRDYTLFFGMYETVPDEFLLVGCKDDQTFDLVPAKVFGDLLPSHFIHDYIHWFNRANRTIEFRPKNTPWNSSPSYWRMENISTTWKLMREGHLLVSPTSNTALRLCRLLEPLESGPHIHIIHRSPSGVVEIDMPRLQLGFQLTSGSIKLQSHQFRGMYVDDVQSIGALHGVMNKLVLRDNGGRRKVLVAGGRVSCAPTMIAGEGHVNVYIEHGTAHRVHQYEVDETLGRLVDSGSLQSKLILSYLHALTSYCLPDPLTGKTGTEQALSMLNSAAVRSFDCLSQENLDMLRCIAKLSPGRTYYPQGHQVMETIDWDSRLSFLSQHGGFNTSVQSIFAQASSRKFFHRDSYIKPDCLKHVTYKLGRRHSIRASTFQVSGFGCEEFSRDFDEIYKARDHPSFTDRSARAFDIATMVFRKDQHLHRHISPKFEDHIWGLLNSSEPIKGPNIPLNIGDVGYDGKWLDDPDTRLGELWCRFHRTLGKTTSHINQFRTLMCLATLAFAKKCDPQAIQALAAFTVIPSVQRINVPDAGSFTMNMGHNIDSSRLYVTIQEHAVPFTALKELDLPRLTGESNKSHNQRRRRIFDQKRDTAIHQVISFLKPQWVCETPQTPSDGNLEKYIRISSVMGDVRSFWELWYRNHLFYEYLCRTASALRQCPVRLSTTPKKRSRPLPSSYGREQSRSIREQDLFLQPAPTLVDVPDVTLGLFRAVPSSKRKKYETTKLIDRLGKQITHQYEENYVEDLRRSRKALEIRDTNYELWEMSHQGLIRVLKENLSQCSIHVDSIYRAMVDAMGLHDSSTHHSCRQIATRFMAPRVSQTFFLQQLTHKKWQRLAPSWKKAIVSYALALTRLQRARRILKACSSEVEMLKELTNVGHTNWDPSLYSESLLLEVESGIIIRDVQEDIAAHMRSPRDNKNAVMQLNMGEGKSSVIVPILAALLADGNTLVRVVVGKPQAKELLRTLISKLGGLLGHRVYQMPFSRSLMLSPSEAREVDKIYKECMSNGGILLVQPEHILSFKLMGIECYESGREEVGRTLLDTQHFLNLHSRDIVDESDENFSVKFELVYTMGTQNSIELSPERWFIMQRLLGFVSQLSSTVKKELPDSIEITHDGHGRFSRTRILKPDGAHCLLKKLAWEICATGLPGFAIARQSVTMRNAVLTYISEAELSSEQIASVEGNSLFFTESTKGPLLLLRGLIAGGVLGFTLSQKRWRVNYGLDPTRQPKTRLAIPYRAKDNPSARSEFSHPDVVIVLTCLSYYYGGLSDDDLFLAFDHLIKSDQAEMEYNEWAKDAVDLPSSFHRLIGINMKDRHQMVSQIFPCLRFTKNVIDYFLAHIVFPKEMKEFSQKLSASGWDIGQSKGKPTTGFSGTNDSRHLLPLDVEHLDLEEQRHTNALVLEHLLRQENGVISMLQPNDTSVSDAETLLRLVTSMKPDVQVILDVGAQILELTNIQVAKRWLEMVPEDKEVVVFFNDHDDICVVDRKGYVEQLQTSPYHEKLDVCLVFLDEAHTRGTDLKLPEHYRAAVTLGANLTKDRLVQACMRMRKLGKGQSVVFCIPDEIRSKIQIATGAANDCSIQVADVLIWAISETYADLRRGMPLWAVQGVRFQKQKAVWAGITTADGISMSRNEAEKFLEDEAQTLEYRYKPRAIDLAHSLLDLLSLGDANLAAIRKRCEEFDITQFKSSALQEEQERELSPEIEQERQIERPKPAQPERHNVDPHLYHFVRTGSIPFQSRAFKPAFETLENTSAAQFSDVKQFPSDIFVTTDYTRTVKLGGRHPCADSYQRPIQWILTSNDDDDQEVGHVVIISPHEAQELMPEIEKSKSTFLHLYAPQPNRSFAPLDALKLYTIPPRPADWEFPIHLRLQLNLFAGQLYFGSPKDYQATCDMLSLSWKPTEDGQRVEADGFIVQNPGYEIFTKSPVKFMKVLLLKIRRDCEGIDKTHWGRILDGVILREEDFDMEAGDF